MTMRAIKEYIVRVAQLTALRDIHFENIFHVSYNKSAPIARLTLITFDTGRQRVTVMLSESQKNAYVRARTEHT
jgi:hypothetical protein